MKRILSLTNQMALIMATVGDSIVATESVKRHRTEIRIAGGRRIETWKQEYH